MSCILLGALGGAMWSLLWLVVASLRPKSKLTPGQASLILAALPYGFFTDMPEFKAAVDVLRKIAGLKA